MRVIFLGNRYAIIKGYDDDLRYYGGMSDDEIIWTSPHTASSYGMVKLYNDRSEAEKVLSMLSLALSD